VAAVQAFRFCSLHAQPLPVPPHEPRRLLSEKITPIDIAATINPKKRIVVRIVCTSWYSPAHSSRPTGPSRIA